MERSRLIELSKFVHSVYEESGGEQKWCNPYPLGSRLGWDKEQTRREIASLRARGVLQVKQLSGSAAIVLALTDIGILCAEEPWKLGQLGIPEVAGNISVHGDNARVNIASVDQSTNVVHSTASQLFSDLRSTFAASRIPEAEVHRLQDKVDELESAQGTAGFTKKYQEFMSLAADHMSVIAPFIQALTGLL